MLVMPIGIVEGLNSQNSNFYPHIFRIELGNSSFSSLEFFGVGHNHFKIQKESNIIKGSCLYNFRSPIGDHISLNYSVVIHKSEFTVNFPQPGGILQKNFRGSTTVENSLNFDGSSDFRYVTFVYVLNGIRNAKINGIDVSGVDSLTGYPFYNLSLDNNYTFYLPGFANVNGNLSPTFVEAYFINNNLVLGFSYNINNLNFESSINVIISSSNENYASNYLEVISSQGGYLSGYSYIMQDYYSLIIGAIIFTLLLLLIYVIYKKK